MRRSAEPLATTDARKFEKAIAEFESGNSYRSVSKKFRNWANKFVEFVADLTANNRKLLLIYDGYRAHLSLEVVEIFANNNIAMYALRAHTSGNTQPIQFCFPLSKTPRTAIVLISTACHAVVSWTSSIFVPS